MSYRQMLSFCLDKSGHFLCSFSTETLAVKTVEMYVEGYEASLVKDTSWKRLWTVSFTLREF